MTQEERDTARRAKAEERARLHAERERQKEEQKRLRDEEKERQRLAKEEEKTKKAEEEARLREEKKRQLEEDRVRKAEEKRLEKLRRDEDRVKQKEDERFKKQQEADQRRNQMGCGKKQAAIMAMFVIKKKPEGGAIDVAPVTTASRFKPFQVQDDMTLAPPRRRQSQPVLLDQALTQAAEKNPSARELLAGHVQALRQKRSRYPAASAPSGIPVHVVNDEDDASMAADDVIVMSTPALVPRHVAVRMKLLQFREDVRPPYFGTFRRRSRKVYGRRPLGRADGVVDYDYDSEAEWEPEAEEGDDCVSGEEDEEEDAGGADAEGDADDDNAEDRWLVPHGYLSDDERGEDEQGVTATDVNADAPQSTSTARRARVSVGCLWGRAACAHPLLGKYCFEPMVATPIRVGETVAPTAPEPIASASELTLEGTADGGAGRATNPLPEDLLPGWSSCCSSSFGVGAK